MLCRPHLTVSASYPNATFWLEYAPLSIIIPLSTEFADPEANNINLSSINKSAVLTVVVVPSTYKLPLTVKLLPIVTLLGNPTVTVCDVTSTSTSFCVPCIINPCEPNDTEPLVYGWPEYADPLTLSVVANPVKPLPSPLNDPVNEPVNLDDAPVNCIDDTPVTVI